MIPPRDQAVRHNRAAFTLIEVLAVVVLMMMVAVAATSSLSSSSAAADLIRIRAGCARLDAQGRLFARTCASSVALRVNHDSNALELVQLDVVKQLASVPLPSDLTIRFEIDNNPVESVVFDRLGRSPDYRAVFGQGARATQMNIAGLTGLAFAQHEMERAQ